MVGARHRGGMVRRGCLEALGLSVTKAAEGLGVSRQALSELVNEESAESVEMAIRLSKAFGSSQETWLGMQTACGLWVMMGRMSQLNITKIEQEAQETILSTTVAPTNLSPPTMPTKS